MIPQYPSYDEIHSQCLNIAKNIKQKLEKIDLVIGLSRGGLLPGVILSHELDVKFKPLEYSSVNGKGSGNNCNEIPKWINENKISQTAIVVDDLTDSGYTMKEVFDILSQNNFIVKTATVYHKESSVFVPDFYGWKIPEDFGWIYFPFEKR